VNNNHKIKTTSKLVVLIIPLVNYTNKCNTLGK